jgi:MoCo/4Fe-4S cofactor protein with predicted Tat translocation signal
MSDKKYWQSFAELNNKEEFQKRNRDEFQEELPFEDLDGKGWLDAKSPRRDFLKYLGFSTAAATIAASCEMPVRKAVPYVNRPENVTPGVAKYYATTYVQDGDVLPMVAKVRDGRPIKLEGNALSSLTQGGTSPRAQAAVLDLYDTNRLTNPKRNNGGKFEEIPTYDQLDRAVTSALAGVNGSVVLLTSTINSPTTKQIISEFLAKYPGSRHVQYDAVSYSGMLLANEATQGRRAIPSYRFDQAKVIVSLGADFLGTWLSPVEFARQYSTGRKINEAAPAMSKHYQFESHLSMTGACADERFSHRPSEIGAVALALYAALGGQATANIADAKLKAGIQKVAADLQKNRGAALVVSGSNDPNVQIVVNAINSAIGAVGSTIDWNATVNYRQGIDKDMVDLVAQMNAGQVGALLIYGANPAYEYFDAASFANGLKKVKLSVSFNEKLDETTVLCNYSVPTHHFLESWGDTEPKAGYISFIQPTIFPLFKTRPYQTALLKWAGNNTDYETYFRQYWTGRLGGQAGFDKALQDGVLESGAAASRPAVAAVTTPAATADTTATTPTPVVTTTTATTNTGSAPFNSGGIAGAVAALSAGKKGGKDELVLYQKVSMATGKQAGNPWLLELPDPITKATWGNYAMISAAKAEELGIEYKSTEYEYYPDKPVIELTVGNKKVQLPVLVIPGMNANTIAVAVGFGRADSIGKAVSAVGSNIYPFARFNGTTIDYYTDVTVSEKTLDSQKIAQTQVHPSYEGRTEVVKETTLATFLKHPRRYTEFREELTKDYAKKTGDYRKEATLYGDYVQPGPKWGMSIDMNLCIGCNACVVACHAENNVPVVGKREVLRAHEMHWLRIDRYFVSDEKNPDDLKAVVFQPMLCQHCDNAPCENVCPVSATMHNSEGLNQMAYNRCIGTRYCANNCPYKVRRFNWADYTGATSFGKGGAKTGVGVLDDVVHQMNDDLTRMVINPDVVTRSRGVMEKCTFCVQRTQEGKLKAKLENRELKGDEVQTACAQACPTSAIRFSNVNDKTSEVAQIREKNPGRLFYVIEQLHTLPNVNYLAKIRNTDEIVGVTEEHAGGEHAAQSESERSVPSEHKEGH